MLLQVFAGRRNDLQTFKNEIQQTYSTHGRKAAVEHLAQSWLLHACSSMDGLMGSLQVGGGKKGTPTASLAEFPTASFTHR